jgi:hypothetical protein
MIKFVLPIVLTAAALAACNTNAPMSQTGMAPLMDESVPEVARNACLDEVGRVANNSVRIIGMIYSEANSQVTVGVGPTRAPWRCLVSNSGEVVDVTSLADEGAL